MKYITNIVLICLICMHTTQVFSQEKSLKEQALEKFKSENYNDAISLLEQALNHSPNDADIYYYLGWFNHYQAYDSRPLKGYDYRSSERIFEYLNKAIELNPQNGDAKYFYGAECSGNAFNAMQNYDSEKLKYFYELAYKKGAYPDWLIEFGENFLNSCDQNAILFTAGNADFDVCSYLQLCCNFRIDITLIPIGNIDRPWYVSFLKKGLKNSVRRIEIGLTENQILDIHPFKWKETDVLINVSQQDKQEFNLPTNYQMQWAVFPDLQSERMSSKIESETANKRTYLSPRQAILLQIVEDNFSNRPIYFSNFAEASLYGGLNEYFQNCGLVSKLTPIKTKDTDFQFDRLSIEKLLIPNNFNRYKNIKTNNIPRISRIALFGYANAVLNLADIYSKSNNRNELENMIKMYSEKLKIDFNSAYEQSVIGELQKLLP